MEHSTYQKNIFKYIETGKGHAIIKAVAGSGKTYTIVESLKKIPPYKKVIFCAFNNHIVQELKSRVPTNVLVTTIHSLGWRAMLSYYPGAKLNQYKIWEISKRVFWNVNKKEQIYYTVSMEKLINLFRSNMCSSSDELIKIAEKHDVDIFYDERGEIKGEMVENAFKIFRLMIENTVEFDFTDMVYVPAVNEKIKLPEFDYVFVDESQDLNVAQQAIIKRILNKNGRLIAVGDPMQSIYGFAGSDVESFNKFKNFKGIQEFPLSVCYRCNRDIVKHAKELVPYIEWNEDNGEGKVRNGSYKEIKDGDWVLCRNVKPLISLCLQMLKEKRKAYIKGDDIGKGIITLLKRLNTNDVNKGMRVLLKKIDDLKIKLKDYGISNTENHSQVISLKEKISVINSLKKEYKSIDSMIQKLEEVFSEKHEGIMLSTIHKSKGLENERVFFLMPELIPSKYAWQDWQLQQERNLKYVAITRAKEELVYINDYKVEIDDFESIKREYK